MKLSEILDQWDKDCRIDNHDLYNSNIKTPEIYAKYLKIYNIEKKLLSELDGKYKKLRKSLWEYYTGKSTGDVYRKEPFQLKLLKTDVPQYIESNDDYIELKAKRDFQKQKVETVERILDMIKIRNWTIKNAVELHKLDIPE